MYITTKIETREEQVERKAQEFFDRRGRRPYGLVLKLVAAQVDYKVRSF